MFDFDAGKLLIIGVIALIVIGPKDLPRVLRQVGQAVGRLRRMASEFQGQFMDAMKEADIQDIRDELAKVNQEASKLTADFDPVRDVRSELSNAVAPPEPMAGISAPDGPAEGFSLPHLPPVEAEPFEPEQVSSTLASAGLAPIVEDELTATPDTAGRKRKIVLPKRRGPLGPAAARTEVGRFRNVRPRRHEAAEP